MRMTDISRSLFARLPVVAFGMLLPVMSARSQGGIIAGTVTDALS